MCSLLLVVACSLCDPHVMSVGCFFVVCCVLFVACCVRCLFSHVGVCLLVVDCWLFIVCSC